MQPVSSRQMPVKTTVTLFCLLATMVSVEAEAATRTVCFGLQIADTRYNCPVPGTTGVDRSCDPNTGYQWAVGHRVELWDKDSGDGSYDDYIGTWRIAASGRQCATFEWEDASYSKGEANPDLYIRHINEVRSSASGTFVRGVRGDGSSFNATWWRNGKDSDADVYVARNCTAGIECQIYPSANLVPVADATQQKALMLMAIDSAVRALERFEGSIKDSDTDIEVYVDDLANLPLPCPWACSENRTDIYIPTSLAEDGHRAAHEVGHALHMREFGQDVLRNDCSLNGEGWDMTSTENESCATAEGFATYVGAVAWYDPDNESTVPFANGYNLERAKPYSATCSMNAGMPLQVTKTFWDLDDANNETGSGITSGADDLFTFPSKAFLDYWDRFQDGTGNRQDEESDVDGVNMRDYKYNGAWYIEEMLEHNCLQSQDDD